MSMDKDLALRALKMLDKAVGEAQMPVVKMVTGGGSAMLLAYDFPGRTNDVDAIPTNANFDDIKLLAEEVAKSLNIEHDWLNPYFQSFTVYLPNDAKSRMIKIYNGKNLIVESLGPEDILIMKLMAGRAKDLAHTKYLLKRGVKLKVVEDRLYELRDKKLYAALAEKALNLLDELTQE